MAVDAMTDFCPLSAPGFDPDFSGLFGREAFAAAFLGDGPFSGLAWALLEFDPGLVREASRLPRLVPVDEERAVPGALKTTSSLFERCSTCAVAPG